MNVNPQDGRCRACGGQLTVIDADDATLTVECQNPQCRELYAVEHDAFNDGAMHYWPHFVAGQMEGGDDE